VTDPVAIYVIDPIVLRAQGVRTNIHTYIHTYVRSPIGVEGRSFTPAPEITADVTETDSTGTRRDATPRRTIIIVVICVRYAGCPKM